MTRLRIAQVAPFYYPQHGGVETVVKEYSERLVKRGHEVHVFTTDGGFRDPRFEEINGVKVYRSLRIPYPVLKPLSPAPLFPLKLLEADVDLIHVHANKYFSTDMGALIAKLRGLPLVYSSHAGTFGQSFVGRLHNQTAGRIALSADVVVCVSNYEKGLIESSGIPVKRFEVLPNGVDRDKFKVQSSKFKVAIDNSKFMVLYVGRLSPHKGIDTLIVSASLVLRNIPDVKFVIAGPGESSNLKSQTSNLNLDDHFVFTGEVLEEEKIALLKKADVFVLPSRSEAFGITVIEAMAAGCPPIVSDIPALTEIVSNGRTGLVFPVDDEKALSNSIIKLLSNQSLHQDISKTAKKAVQEKYDWEKIIDRLEDIYSGLVLPK